MPNVPVNQGCSRSQATVSAASSAYVPPSVLINAQMELLHVFGDVSNYLGLPVGRVDFNLLNLIRKDFRTEVQTLVHQAQH